MQTDTINTIIDDLAALPGDDETFNQYAHDNPDNAIRRENLLRYLQRMQARNPHTLMVMEAPGYRGCRLTGIPVTSRRVMLEGVPELELFGTERGYTDTDDDGFERIQGEQSATIVWQTLADLGRAPLIWNTFPLHPHKPGNLRSNRKPRKPETDLGGDFLRTIIMIYKPEVIIAVGNVAHNTLTGMGINCVKVRHPAQGGKQDFVEGMTKLLTS
jgi:uracil-DNA glycosylase